MFIVFEGIDGSGKTTQAQLLVQHLNENGIPAIYTKEPGGWDGGEKMRDFLLHGDVQGKTTELMMFFADRSEHVARVIEPALKEGKVVVCDRYTDSTIAYQCFGRGHDQDLVEQLIALTKIPRPDLTIYCNITPEQALQRRTQRGEADRIEQEKMEFFNRVKQGFDILALKNPRGYSIDATQSVEDQARKIAWYVDFSVRKNKYRDAVLHGISNTISTSKELHAKESRERSNTR